MTGRVRSLLRAFATVVGLGALGFALAVAYRPAVLPRATRRTLERLPEAVDVRLGLLLVGGMAALYALASGWLRRVPSRSEQFASRRPETANREVAVAGADLTDAYETLRGYGPFAEDIEDPVGDELREVLLATLAREHGTREAARERIADGTWTDDRHAAAFLTDAKTVDYPLTHRLYAWLYPDRAYEARVDRALRAVESVCAGRYTDYDPPDVPPTRRRQLERRVERLLGREGTADGRDRSDGRTRSEKGEGEGEGEREGTES